MNFFKICPKKSQNVINFRDLGGKDFESELREIFVKISDFNSDLDPRISQTHLRDSLKFFIVIIRVTQEDHQKIKNQKIKRWIGSMCDV